MEATDPDSEPQPLSIEVLINTPVADLVAEGIDAEEAAEALGKLLRREHRYLERLSLDLRYRKALLEREAPETRSPEVGAELRGQAAALDHAVAALHKAVEEGCGVGLGSPMIGGEIASHIISADPEEGIEEDGHPRLTPTQKGTLPPSRWGELGLPHPAPPLDLPDAIRPGLDTEAYRAGLQALFEAEGYASSWAACRDAGLTPQEQRTAYRFLRGEVSRAPLTLIEKLGPFYGVRPEGVKRVGYAVLGELIPDEVSALLAAEDAAEAQNAAERVEGSDA